jgi:hypothetical protein
MRGGRLLAILLALLCGLVVGSVALAEVSFTSPGLPPSRMDDQGRLVEDWGAVEIKIVGEGVSDSASPTVQAVKLDEVIPAAQARAQHGAVVSTLTAFRAPVWPAGVDVLTLRFEETAGRDTPLLLTLGLPETVRLGSKTVTLGGRTVVVLPTAAKVDQQTRDWGWADDAVALPGWAKPAVACDPAFRNIRAGMNGVPIHYRFKVEPKAAFNVVLGFCESHWAQTGQRPVVCRVEGAPSQEVDPLSRWGQHQPSAVLFSARDEDSDGKLEVSVLPKPGAPDENPILNVIWVFPAGQTLNLEQVMAGKMNGAALHYVDVGGENDQSLYAGGKVEYVFKLPAKGTQELTFLMACPGSSVSMPAKSAWTSEKLRRAAREVWRDWRER